MRTAEVATAVLFVGSLAATGEYESIFLFAAACTSAVAIVSRALAWRRVVNTSTLFKDREGVDAPLLGQRFLLVEVLFILLSAPIMANALVLADASPCRYPTLLLGGALATLAGVLTLVYVFWPSALRAALERDLQRGYLGDFYLLGVPYVLFWGMTLVLYALHAQRGPAAFTSVPSAVTIWTWALYTFDLHMSVVLLDFLELHGLRLSPIEHIRAAPVGTLIFMYKLVVAIGFVSLLVSVYRHLRKGPWP